MSIVVLVASESRTLLQTPDPNGLVPLLSVDWRELVFGSTPLPANEQVGLKIHPGQVTATSILFKHNISSNSPENMYHSSSPSALPASPASAVIGISVLWQFPIYKHCHRILCSLQQLKLDVEQALRDESHYLLTHVVNAFVLRHERNGSFSNQLLPSQLPPFSSCLQLLERELGLNFVAQVLANALICFYSSRRQKLILHTNESPLILQHLMYAIYYVIANVTIKNDSGSHVKTSYNEAVFVEEEMEDKSVWVKESNIEDLTNDAFASNYQSSNVTKVSPFLPDSSFINEQQSRMASSEDESLGYFSSSSSQGSTTAIEIANNDDLVVNGESEKDVHLNGELLGNSSGAFTRSRNAIRSATQSEPINEPVSVSSVKYKSDEISSFQGFLREYTDLRFKSSPSSSPPSSPVPRDECTLQSTHASKNSSAICLVPVKECNGLLYTCYPVEERSNLFTSLGSLAISHTNSRELFGSSSPCNLVVDVENLVNLIPNETCLLPHYMVQGMLMKKSDRIDDLVAALSKCTCEGCSYCDRSCTFKLIDLDTVSPSCESTTSCAKSHATKGGFILEMLRSILHLKQLGLPEKIVCIFCLPCLFLSFVFCILHFPSCHIEMH